MWLPLRIRDADVRHFDPEGRRQGDLMVFFLDPLRKGDADILQEKTVPTLLAVYDNISPHDHSGDGDVGMNGDSELLTGLSIEELEALANSLLAPTPQGRLDELLARRNEKPLSGDEEIELDRLLQRADQLTILKTRARYTLSQAKAETAGA